MGKQPPAALCILYMLYIETMDVTIPNVYLLIRDSKFYFHVAFCVLLAIWKSNYVLWASVKLSVITSEASHVSFCFTVLNASTFFDVCSKCFSATNP